jgi:pimeloyl-ACP methyl ester carboxylesterase
MSVTVMTRRRALAAIGAASLSVGLSSASVEALCASPTIRWGFRGRFALSRPRGSALAAVRGQDFAAVQQAYRSVNVPVLLLWGREDEVFDAATFAKRFQEILPHAEGPHLVTGRHFLQEDSGPEIAARIVDFIARLPRP